MTDNTKLYSGMVRHLEASIVSGVYAPGMRVPSLRELTANYNISLGTARRGIDYLVSKGLLEFRHGSGTYVARQLNPGAGEVALRKIAVFLVHDNHRESYCAQALNGAQELAAGAGCSLLLNFVRYDRLDETMIRANSEGCAGMIFLGCYDSCLKQLTAAIPGVGLSMHHAYDGSLSLIELDPFNAAELACRFFVRQGKSHIRIVSHHMPPHQIRGEIFASYWRDYGSSEVLFHDDQDVRSLDVGDDRCGYYFVSGEDCNSTSLHFRKEHGMTLAEGRCVVSVDGKSLFVPGFHPVNTLAVDWHDAGSVALEECLRRINHPGSPARRIYLNCRMHEIA